jgi:hypothetical protein
MAYKYGFKWIHDGKTLHLPKTDDKAVMLESQYAASHGHKRHMVCPYCYENDMLEQSEGNGGLKQKYVCGHCEHPYTMRDLPYRQDDDSEMVYTKSQWKKFSEQETGTDITDIIVEEEVPIESMADLMGVIPLFKSVYQVYANSDDYSMVMAKVHAFMTRDGFNGLICSFGYRQEEKWGLLFPSGDGVMLAVFRDIRLVKDKLNDFIQATPNPLMETIAKYAVSQKADLYEEFIEKLQQGEKFEEEEETIEVEAVIGEADWL